MKIARRRAEVHPSNFEASRKATDPSRRDQKRGKGLPSLSTWAARTGGPDVIPSTCLRRGRNCLQIVLGSVRRLREDTFLLNILPAAPNRGGFRVCP